MSAKKAGSNGNGSAPTDKIGSVMVVGAGIGGMQASLDLANAGYKVYLVEETSSIGGRMAQLDKTFPTNDCSMCTISPKLIEVGKHMNIEILTNSQVSGISGRAGSYTIDVHQKARYVDMVKCNACGDCVAVCPIPLPSEFDEGTMDRRAIHKRYPQAIPGEMAISKQSRPPCVISCKADTRPQAYLALVAEGRFEDAYRVIKRGNPFPAVCGRVCHHPCELNCNRNEIDQPVAINPVKRFLADWARDQRAEKGDSYLKPSALDPDDDKKDKKVVVVGGGPAGLTAARDLTMRGYPVTLLEAEDKLGGMMRYGIPSYRLPWAELDRDIEDICSYGFEVKTGVKLGKDVTMSELKKEYKAVFLGIGAQGSARLPETIKGQELEGVHFAMDFLRETAKGNPPTIGKNVLVIGGGNVAIDVVMTSKRLGAEKVRLACLECRDEMPAHDWEIADAVDEGAVLACEWGPEEIVDDGNGKVKGVSLVRCTCVFDADKRFNPQYDDECHEFFEADTVIVAIGQRTEADFVAKNAKLKVARGKLAVDKLTLQSDDPMVFAGGDGVTIPASVMQAIGAGHEAAESIDRYLQGMDLAEGRTLDPPEAAPVPDYKEFPELPRQKETKIPLTERTGFAEITHGLTAEQAVAEAKRCLACGLCCECEMCVEACGPKAIVHDDVDKDFQLQVGSLVLTPGFEKFDPSARDEFGHGRYENVITSLEFERILSASGPYQGHVKRPSDLKTPKRMAWIQCVGSRDPNCGNDYCSSVCCMYAIKESLMAVDHVPGLEATVFYNDIRAYGKGFEQYFENSKSMYGVKYKRGIISTVKEKQQTKNLVLTYVTESGEITEEEFDMVVLSIGLRPSKSTGELADVLSLNLNRFGFCEGEGFDAEFTNQEGIFVAGAFAAPMDIPETVMTAATAVAKATEYLAEARGSLVTTKEYPDERDTTGEEPRIGVFICRCGTNIARAVEVPSVVEYAKTLPGVAHAEENLYTCSSDTQTKITNTIREHNLNRVVVASCTPRTHEPLFQDTLREAGLNKYLFEMANIRDQCSWVHSADRETATFKAEDLVRMAVARAGTLESLTENDFEVDPRALVIGGGIAGLIAALTIAGNGFECTLVERTEKLGGMAWRIGGTLQGVNPKEYVQARIDEVTAHPKIHVLTGAEVVETGGHVGKFVTKVKKADGEEIEIGHGASVLATGGMEYKPTEYGYGESQNVVTQLELDELMESDRERVAKMREVVMIQCVGSREEGHPYCSRVCCQSAVRNAIELKELNPDMSVTVLFRDMRTYGFNELAYQKARDMGVLFVRYDPDSKPVVKANGSITVEITDDVSGFPLDLRPDLLVLSAAIRPQEDRETIASQFKTALNADGFYLEAHMKLRPLDFSNDGMFLAGIAHAPKTMAETVAQAKGAAARVATILSSTRMTIPATVSEVDQDRCAACLTCARLCPYDVPVVRSDTQAAYIEPALCQGCGVCASVCPRKAISLKHYRDGQLVAKVETLFGDEEFEKGHGVYHPDADEY